LYGVKNNSRDFWIKLLNNIIHFLQNIILLWITKIYFYLTNKIILFLQYQYYTKLDAIDHTSNKSKLALYKSYSEQLNNAMQIADVTTRQKEITRNRKK